MTNPLEFTINKDRELTEEEQLGFKNGTIISTSGTKLKPGDFISGVVYEVIDNREETVC